MELICINDKYSEGHLKVFNKYGIQYPKEGEIVSVVRIDFLPLQGKTGLIVSPYDNQFIPSEKYGIKSEKEVSFNKERFLTLDKRELTNLELAEIKANLILK